MNLESIQSESDSLIKQLKNSERKVSSSSEDLKEQYLSAIQVLQTRLHPLQEDLLTCQPFITSLHSAQRCCFYNNEIRNIRFLGLTCVVFFFCGVFSGEPAGM